MSHVVDRKYIFKSKNYEGLVKKKNLIKNDIFYDDIF